MDSFFLLANLHVKQKKLVDDYTIIYQGLSLALNTVIYAVLVT